MDIKQLITFKTAAENLNFTKTAKLLNFAQSSVTSQMKALETELGIPLFERIGKRLVLTEYGKKYKLYADKMIMLTKEAEWAISNHRETTGTLVIGAQESQCTYRLPPILKEFKEQFPKVKLVFKPAHSDEISRRELLQGNLDIAFITDTSKPSEIFYIEPLIQEKIKLVVNPDHPLTQKLKVLPKDLEHETLLLMENGCSYRTLLEDTLDSFGVHPKDILEFLSIEAMKQCTIAGLGIAVLPAMAVEEDINNGRMKELSLGIVNQTIYTHIAWHKDKQMITPFREFIELSREQFSKLHVDQTI
ncbi:LysR family transcriptional regulator [Oceanobacillus piezotolerans]|uniref:LysR family transcriptional regulator n=1 Tax=Oceanobacillus piezotolerans TaxID=2448030 RepID=A0A498D9P4_9BACI|nr:LysR family transcriptional regulator [Oceanobacillus piezotolerans]RLL45537.1 LysR family transcriptional regulator [Oceanobacillus piezotolerans]